MPAAWTVRIYPMPLQRTDMRPILHRTKEGAIRLIGIARSSPDQRLGCSLLSAPRLPQAQRRYQTNQLDWAEVTRTHPKCVLRYLDLGSSNGNRQNQEILPQPLLQIT